jgi:lysylphosphatidylglycerol synthetase-like protein (DUF2156 family)
MGSSQDDFDINRYLPPGPGAWTTVGTPVPGPPVGGPSTVGIEFSKPQSPWLVGAAVSAFCGLVLALCGFLVSLPTVLSMPTAVAAWVLAAPAGIGLLAVYRHRDAREQAKPGYTMTAASRALGVAVPVLIFLGAVASSLRLAEWAGRQ